MDTSISLLPTTHIDILELDKEVAIDNITEVALLEIWTHLSEFLMDTIISSLNTTLADSMNSFLV